MGQPKFQRKKYDTPNHPWQGDRIKEEHEIVRKFGLKNKREIWKAQTRLREIRGQARTLVSRTRNPDDDQAGKEAKQLLARLHRQGYTGEGATLNEVLGLDVERILNRRLQSQVYLKGMARTMKQARQFVNHGCIRIGDRRVTVPGYVVRREEEGLIEFDPDTAVADEAHPVRPKPAGYEAVESVREAEPAAEEAPAEAAETAGAAPAEAAEPPASPQATEATDAAAAPEASEETAAAAPAEAATEEAPAGATDDDKKEADA